MYNARGDSRDHPPFAPALALTIMVYFYLDFLLKRGYRFPLAGRCGRCTFPYSSNHMPLRTLETIRNKQKKTLKDIQKKANQLNILALKE